MTVIWQCSSYEYYGVLVGGSFIKPYGYSTTHTFSTYLLTEKRARFWGIQDFVYEAVPGWTFFVLQRAHCNINNTSVGINSWNNSFPTISAKEGKLFQVEHSFPSKILVIFSSYDRPPQRTLPPFRNGLRLGTVYRTAEMRGRKSEIRKYLRTAKYWVQK